MTNKAGPHFSETPLEPADVAMALMREALTLLDEPEALPAREHLLRAIEVLDSDAATAGDEALRENEPSNQRKPSP